MKAHRKEKMTFQEYDGHRWWKQIATYLKNRGLKVSKKRAMKLV